MHTIHSKKMKALSENIFFPHFQKSTGITFWFGALTMLVFIQALAITLFFLFMALK